MPEPVFPLLSVRRGSGLTGGTRRSLHRGTGSEIAGSRGYRRGDSVRTIDWKASARVSSAREADEFVVREHFAEDALRVVLVVDRRPEMRLFPEELPWLHKPEAVRVAGRMVVESALAAQGFPGYLELVDPRAPRWLAPRRQLDAVGIRERELTRDEFTAPPENVTLALRHLLRRRAEAPRGTFVFVFSDFLGPQAPAVWSAAAARGWELVPVIVQDPRWEQSFPDVSGVSLPLATPGAGGAHAVRLGRNAARARRDEHERRLETLLAGFRSGGLDPVLLSSHDPAAIRSEFMRWHERRLSRLRRR
ncbi:MAG TPA: DUF58 domain-containing protein [Gaiellaceae bacterium]|nr:DUF58 domain-containing protein [Gaiellaceae bacterium]